MFEGAFSFGGRIGRLSFFLQGLAMVPAAGIAAAALAFLVYPARRDGLGLAFFIGCAALLGLVAAWYSLSLHVRRIRDIGWDPVVVIVGWIALAVGDPVVAHLVPSLAAGGHHPGTWVGAILNLALSAALLLWPGHDGPDAPLDTGPRMTRVEALGYSSSQGAAPVAARPRRPQGFGRRGLG